MEKSLYLYMCIYITTDVRWFFNYDYVVVHASVGTRLRIYKYAAKNNNPLFLIESYSPFDFHSSLSREERKRRERKIERSVSRINKAVCIHVHAT